MFPHRLRGLGYHTALIGKLHAQAGGIEAQHRHPHDGFDVYELYYGGGAMMHSPLNAYAPWVRERRPDVYRRLVESEKAAGPIPLEVHMNTWAAERAGAYLDARPASRPFFLMVSVFDPHNPYDDHPPEAARRVDAGGLPPLIPPPDDRGAWPEEVRREAADNYFGDAREIDGERLHAMRVGYHAEVGLVDELVGRVVGDLERRGLLDETLVLFCSDHGDMLGDHGLMVKGAVWYEANVRVPALARWPGRLPAGVRHPGPIQLNDLTALMLGAAGLDPTTLRQDLPDAIDPTPRLLDPSSHGREIAVTAYRNSGLARGHVPFDPPIHGTMATDGRWKLGVYHNPPPDAATSLRDAQLFDLTANPLELVNLFDRPEAGEPQRRLLRAINSFLLDEVVRTSPPSRRTG